MEASAITSPTYNHVGSLFDYVLVIEREAVLDAVPTISDEDEDMLRDVALFCAPRGIDGTMAIGTRSQTACWTFVLVRVASLPSGRLPCAAGRRASRKLRRPHPRVFVCACRRGLQTDLTGARRYGTCLAFCWPPAAPKDGGGRPSEVQSTHSLCLLSRVPVGDTARRLLRVLHELLSLRLDPEHAARPSPDSFTEAAARIVTEAPNAVGISVRFSFAAELQLRNRPIAPICCQLSGPRELPAQDVSLLLLFQCLSVRHVLSVLACLCTERSVVFASRSTSLPPRCWEAMLSLLWPLQWPLVYVPLLPDSLSMYLQAPTIFAYGVHTAALDEQLQDPDGLNGVVVVDLDADTVTATDVTPRLPKQAAEALHRSVRAVLYPGIEEADDPFSDGNEGGGGTEPLSDALRERKIRCAFAAFFASLLLHIDGHIAGVASIEDNPEDNDDEVASLTGQPAGYAELRKSGFLQDWSASAGPHASLDLPFMEDFIQTQMMMVFVDQRRRWAQQVREAARDGVAEEVMLEFVDSPWEQLRRLAAAREDRASNTPGATNQPSSGGPPSSEQELMAKIERGGSAPPLYEVAIGLELSQPSSPDDTASAKQFPSRLHALSEKLNSAIMHSPAQPPLPQSSSAPSAGMDAMEEFYAKGTAEPVLIGFYKEQDVDCADSNIDEEDAQIDQFFTPLKQQDQQPLLPEPAPELEPEPEQELEPPRIQRFKPGSIAFEASVPLPEFTAPAKWAAVEFWHARVSRLVDGLTATLCTRPKAANLYLCRAAANEKSEQPLAALQDYVRAWCLDRFLRDDIGGGEAVIQRLCNAVGRIDSQMGSEAAILGYAVRGLYAVTALADALIGQAGERQLGEVLHRCVATARSNVPEVPAPTPAEAEAVAEEESRLTPPFDSIIARCGRNKTNIFLRKCTHLPRKLAWTNLEGLPFVA
jgi:hypothetical protein